MRFESDLQWPQVQDLADQLVHQTTRRHLSDVELQVLRGAWDGQTYEAIATQSHLTVKYVGEVGGRLWSMLSAALGEEVKKTNFRQALQRYQMTNAIASTEIGSDTLQNLEPRQPDPILDDYDYHFLPVAVTLTELQRPGALIRIKAPLQFGKTTLMSQVLRTVDAQGYRPIALNLRDAEPEDCAKLDDFLRWFLSNVTCGLGLEVDLDQHWRKALGNSKIKCRTYFEKYLLREDSPLVIALDEVDRLYAYPTITGEFLGMLRTWHEDAKTKSSWKGLRVLVLHTEVYQQLEINQSPFNAGVEIGLQDWTIDQVQTLIKSQHLKWNITQIKTLMDWVGGHPYLVAQAVEQLSLQKLSLESFLTTVASPNGAYRTHLERHWHRLQTRPELLEVYRLILATPSAWTVATSEQLEAVVNLYDLGLVQLQQSQATPRYRLYRQYFGDRLGIVGV